MMPYIDMKDWESEQCTSNTEYVDFHIHCFTKKMLGGTKYCFCGLAEPEDEEEIAT